MAETETQPQPQTAVKTADADAAATTKRKDQLSVLITGCSEGGIGAALAEEFQRRGLWVFATARNVAKIPDALRTLPGVEVLPLDVTDPAGIRAAAAAVTARTGGTLNVLVNNAGGGYQAPLLDADLDEGRRLFETNVWSVVAVTQAFAPMLLAAANKKAGTARVVNIGSVAGYTMVPWQGLYNASKGALAMINDTLRIELQPLGIKVIHVITGAIKTKFYGNAAGQTVPEGSLYAPIAAEIESGVAGHHAVDLLGTTTDEYARTVVSNALSRYPTTTLWTGANSLISWTGKRFGFDFAIDLFMMYLFKLLGLRRKYTEEMGLTKKAN